MSDNPSAYSKTSYLIAYDIQRVLPGGTRVSVCAHGPRMPIGFGRLVDARKVRDALYAAYIDAGTIAVLEIVPLAVSEDFGSFDSVSESDETIGEDGTPDYMALPAIKFS